MGYRRMADIATHGLLYTMSAITLLLFNALTLTGGGWQIDTGEVYIYRTLNVAVDDDDSP